MADLTSLKISEAPAAVSLIGASSDVGSSSTSLPVAVQSQGSALKSATALEAPSVALRKATRVQDAVSPEKMAEGKKIVDELWGSLMAAFTQGFIQLNFTQAISKWHGDYGSQCIDAWLQHPAACEQWIQNCDSSIIIQLGSHQLKAGFKNHVMNKNTAESPRGAVSALVRYALYFTNIPAATELLVERMGELKSVYPSLKEHMNEIVSGSLYEDLMKDAGHKAQIEKVKSHRLGMSEADLKAAVIAAFTKALA